MFCQPSAATTGQNATLLNLHFYLEQPSGSHTSHCWYNSEGLEREYFKSAVKTREKCTSTSKIHNPGGFPCPWSHLPPDAENLVKNPSF